ncbi:IS66 family insertion sequence element accessory protein TnpB [Lachnospiraceae bacterium 29-84]
MTPPALKPYTLSAAILICAPAWSGWLLLYKRLSESRFQWPRTPEEVRGLTPQQFRWLMEGLTITPKKSARPVEPTEYMGWLCAKRRNFQTVFLPGKCPP